MRVIMEYDSVLGLQNILIEPVEEDFRYDYDAAVHNVYEED